MSKMIVALLAFITLGAFLGAANASSYLPPSTSWHQSYYHHHHHWGYWYVTWQPVYVYRPYHRHCWWW